MFKGKDLVLKISIMVVLLLAIYTSMVALGKSSVVYGRRSSNATKLRHAVVTAQGRMLRIVTRKFYFKQDTSIPLRNISAIVVTDNSMGDHGGEVSLLKGGPGYPYATMRMISVRGYGMNFSIDIYGI